MAPRQTLLRLVGERYPAMACDLLAPLLDLLSVGREACGGDMDKYLIMLVVAVRAAGHKAFADFTVEQLETGEVPVFPSLGLNIQSIADSIGAPKETVRRKVTDLVEAGWIERRGNELYYTALAYQRLAPVRERLARMAVGNFELIAALAREAEAEAEAGSGR